MRSNEDKSLVAWRGDRHSRTAVVCFPWAGAGAAVSRDFSAYVEPSIAVYGVRLAGRESRMREALPSTLDEVVRELAVSIEALPHPNIALFGQCSGAILALEVVDALDQGAAARLRHLFVASQLPPKEVADATGDVDARRFVPVELQTDPEMTAMVLPTIEADMKLLLGYTRRVSDRVSVPITVLRGSADDEVSAHAVLRWADVAGAGADFHEIAGATHLFGPADWPLVAEVLNNTLAPTGLGS